MSSQRRAASTFALSTIPLVALLAYGLYGSPDLPAQTQADHPHVLVVDELDAATAAGLDAERCLAVVTVTGGAACSRAHRIASWRGRDKCECPPGAWRGSAPADRVR